MRVTLRELLTNIDHFYFKSTFFEAELGEHFSIAWYFLPNLITTILYLHSVYTTTSNSSKKLILLSTKWTLILTKNIIDILWTVVN